MGFVGGFLPAARAARLKIVDALRADAPPRHDSWASLSSLSRADADLELDLACDHATSSAWWRRRLPSPTGSRSPRLLIGRSAVSRPGARCVFPLRHHALVAAQGMLVLRTQLHRHLSRGAVRRLRARRCAVLDDRHHESRRHPACLRRRRSRRARSSAPCSVSAASRCCSCPSSWPRAPAAARALGIAFTLGGTAARNRRQPGLDAHAAPAAADCRNRRPSAWAMVRSSPRSWPRSAAWRGPSIRVARLTSSSLAYLAVFGSIVAFLTYLDAAEERWARGLRRTWACRRRWSRCCFPPFSKATAGRCRAWSAWRWPSPGMSSFCRRARGLRTAADRSAALRPRLAASSLPVARPIRLLPLALPPGPLALTRIASRRYSRLSFASTISFFQRARSVSIRCPASPAGPGSAPRLPARGAP